MSGSRRLDGERPSYGNNVIGARKPSNAAAQKEVAMGIYKAPVVRDRYKKIISHFNNAKLSKTGENNSKVLLQDGGPSMSLNSVGLRNGLNIQ